MKLKNNIFKVSVLIFYLLAANACSVSYTMSGISIDYDQVKTISIQPFYNDISQGPANISQTFSNAINDYYQQNTNLSLIQQEGDLQIEGGITGYRLQPVAPRSSGNNTVNDFTAQTRLTLTVKVTFYNTTDDTYNFENRNFTFFKDFDNATQDLTTIETELIDEIFEQIIMDIFNASVANW
ncbi:MAG: LPS assembly lipoprotein LptE [Cyclobacteriaceae bacterium]|nr:LPS assembly lipoprotein LptE [Cyclobacteriaceae bacterium]